MGRSRVLRRAGRRTNAALLLVLVGACLSAGVSFAAGRRGPATLATVAHGLLGLGVLALVPWKSAIVVRSAAIPLAGWALLVVVLVCLVAGFVQLLGGYRVVAGLSPMQVHVGAAVVAVPLLAWHVLRRRRQRLRRSDATRRTLLRAAVGVAAVGMAYPLAATVAGWSRGPKGRVATGSGRLPADDIPATSWLLDRVPALPGVHRVDVAGHSMDVADLEQQSEPVRARLDCTSGWYAEATWTGARLSDLIAPDRLAAAASVEVTSATGYTRMFPVTEASNLWLVTRCEGRPLSAGTGAPVRLVAPYRRGFWWVKWVAEVRLSDSPAWLQPPFPLQ